jgi:2-oxo-hept-3-ene-1,7-dioate hydratase
MLDTTTIDTIARAYDAAEKTRTRIRPPSVQYAGFTIEDAYAVQRRWVELKVAAGNVIKGHKIGLTSRAMQRQANITEPDYGALLADMFYADGADIPMSRFIQPRLECELGFIIGRRLRGPDCTIFDVLGATDYVVPAAEIVDGRTHRIDPETDRPRCVLDSIADNAGNAALIVGGRPIRPMDVDLRWVAVLCRRNNVIEESGVAAAVLNHPANGVAWLANKLAPFDLALEAGQFVLSGSFTGTVEAHAGDVFNVDYGPLGSISSRFV